MITIIICCGHWGLGACSPKRFFNLDSLKCGFLSDYVGHFLLSIETLMY